MPICYRFGQILGALQQIDATNGPIAGSRNFYCGGSLKTYDAETRQEIASLTPSPPPSNTTTCLREFLSSKITGSLQVFR
jgi:aminoglycoside phosphotransferase (APT) family kinase protein